MHLSRQFVCASFAIVSVIVWHLSLQDESADPDVEARFKKEIAKLQKKGSFSRPYNLVTAAVSFLGAVIVNCVDDSGNWGRGGFFKSLAALSPLVQLSYENVS